MLSEIDKSGTCLPYPGFDGVVAQRLCVNISSKSAILGLWFMWTIARMMGYKGSVNQCQIKDI